MSKVLDSVKYGTGLAASAAFSFLKINLLGGLSTALAVCVMIVLIVHQSLGGGQGPGHVGGGAILVVLFSVRPVAFLLAAAILLVSPFVLFALGNKYILMKTAGRLLKDNGEGYLYPLLDKALNKLKGGSPELLRRGSDEVKLKLKLAQEIKDGNENKWVKKITTWGLRKADLSTVDFGAEDLSITQVVRDRIVLALRTFATPSRTFFWIILALQWTAVLLTALRVI